MLEPDFNPAPTAVQIGRCELIRSLERGGVPPYAGMFYEPEVKRIVGTGVISSRRARVASFEIESGLIWREEPGSSGMK